MLGDFWSKLRSEIPEEKLAAAAQIVIGANRLPAHLPAGLADELPEGPGVYRLFGEGDVLLYIGRSHSLRTRVLGHFATENSDPKQQKKAHQTRRIDWMETAGDLGAQLKEAEWIKTQKPLFNKRLKPKSEAFTLQAAAPGRGVKLAALADLDPTTDLAGCYGVFQSHRDGRKALTEIARAHSLCMKVLGLEIFDDAASCVGYQFGRCKGACVGKEPLMLHDVRLQNGPVRAEVEALAVPGRVAITEGRTEFHVLDHWAYMGTARSEDELDELRSKASAAAFDADVYRILVRYLAKNPKVTWHALSAPAAHT